MTKTAKNILILTRDRKNASFRQRIEPYIEPLRQRGIGCEVGQLEKSMPARIAQLRQARNFDAVLLQRKTLNYLESLFASRCFKKLIYDFDDAIIHRAQSRGETPHKSRLRRFKRTVKLCDLVFAGNVVLQNQAAACKPRGQVVVLPTGLDTSLYTIKDYDTPRSGKVRLVWIGSKSTLKQVRLFSGMLEELAKECGNIVLRIIADDKLEIPCLEIENLPWSPQTETQLLRESDIAIAPLPDTPFARGKCAFKVLQYMACGLATVTSPVGANAKYIEHEKTGFHANNDNQWISYIKRLAEDADLRKRMGTLAQLTAQKEFDFAVLGETFCNAIEKLLKDDNER